jgi:hypothetical protein
VVLLLSSTRQALSNHVYNGLGRELHVWSSQSMSATLITHPEQTSGQYLRLPADYGR